MIEVPFINLKVQNPDLRKQIDQKLSSLLDTATYIGGEPVNQFAKEFASYCGGGHCIPVANGTDALILALRALGVGPGDEVITTPFTFIATSEAVSVVGARVKFVDINPKNYTIDPALIERAITKNTKAIIPVHLFGQPCDMDSVLSIAKKNNLAVVEDAAQAHGAEYKGKRVGLLGDISCFSFYPTKNLGAFGDAGAVLTSNEKLAHKVTQIANHGRSAQYYHEVEGINSRLDSFQAAILSILLGELEKWNQRRIWIATEYSKAILQNGFISAPTVEPYAKHVFHLYCVESTHRDALQSYLKDNKIACGVYYPLPLHLQPAYAYLGYQRGAFPISERASERILALPMHPTLSDEQVAAVCEALKKFKPVLSHVGAK